MNELDNTFIGIAQIIEEAWDNAYRKVNEELILDVLACRQFLSENSKKQTTGADTSILFLGTSESFSWYQRF